MRHVPRSDLTVPLHLKRPVVAFGHGAGGEQHRRHESRLVFSTAHGGRQYLAAVHPIVRFEPSRSLRPESLHDQSAAGLDRLSPEEFEQFTALNDAYEQRFAFPLIVAVRAPGQTKETIRQSALARLENSPAQEQATALVEIAKIANLRLSDVVAEAAESAEAVVA